MSSPLAGEDKKADADTHLAKARRQNTENGISGDTKDKSSRKNAAAQNEDKGGTRMRILVPIFFLYEFSSQ